VTQPAHPFEAEQRRTIAVLRTIQVPAQAAIAGVVAVLTLLMGDLFGSDRWAGIGGASFTLGSALMAPSFAAFMRRRGRRPGLVVAYAIGSVGAAVAAVGGEGRWVAVVIVGMVMFGAAQSGALQGRYIAADLAAPGAGPSAIAAVVWTGTLGAVFGPVLTPQIKKLGPHVGLDPLVVPLAAAALMAAGSSLLAWRLLRPDPLALVGGIDPHARRVNPFRSVGQSMRVIRLSSAATLGLTSMVVVQATMVAVMTMTPAHMKDHGHAAQSPYVIALHIGGMYGFAPLIGRGVQRYGRVPSIMVGAIVLAAGTVTSVVGGYQRPLMYLGLFLLGVGWNIGLIAGSSLMAESVEPSVRVEVQGTGDLLMSMCGAVAAFSSGFVKAAWGFHLLANAATLCAGLLMVYAYSDLLRSRRISPAG
jgi:MFS family permease